MPVDAVAAGQLQPGTIFGNYRIEKLLGRGGMGSVYQATNLGDGRVVALKLLSVDLDHMDARQRFLREGQSAAAINHPNAVYIYGTEEIDGTPAIVMELVSGGTLEELVRRDGPLPVDDAVEKILQVIDGLDAALAVGVLHRDVKPSNCFVTADGVAKIGDFGLSKPVDSIEQHKLTQTGLFLGTPVYSSPEQLLGESLDERSDIYAVGITFYYLLTGRLPYESGSLMQVMASVLNGTPAPMQVAKATAMTPAIPLHVQQVVLKAMARHAKDRYQTYAEFREAVAALRVPDVRPATLWERFRAYVVDTVPLSYVASGIVLFVLNTRGITIEPNQMQQNIWVPIATYVGMLLAIGIPEGLRGAGLGKWLLGIRVADAEGRPIGLLRSAVRVTFFVWSSFVIVGVYSVVANQALAQALTMLVYIVSLALPFTTARKSNGWRMLHDKLTDSYVVRPVPRPRQRRSDIDTNPLTSHETGARELGQYVLLGDVPAHPGVHSGWDRAMQRRVWVAQPTAATELSEARRSVSRLTRLRWTGAVRQDGAKWDVFEAPTGRPLEQRLLQPVSWPTMRNWLTDLLAEDKAAEADGSWPQGASIEQLWVTDGDEIVLTDALPQHASNNATGATPVQLIGQLATLLLRVRKGDPLSPSASGLLRKLTTLTSLEEADSVIRESLASPVEVSRRRRIGPMFVIATFAIVFGFFSRSLFTQIGATDPEGALADQLIDVMRDKRACTFDYTGPARIQRCLPEPVVDPSQWSTRGKLQHAGRQLAIAVGFSASGDSIVPKDSIQAVEDKRLAELYLVTRLAARVRDTSRARQPAFSVKDQGFADSLLKAPRTVDPSDVARASYMVDTVWQKRTPHDIREYRLLINTTVIAFILSGTSLMALLCAILIRRGALLRGFQLDLVTADGRSAARWRLVLRTVVIWSIMLVPLLTIAIIENTPVGMHALLLALLWFPSLALWIAGMVSVIRNPLRGWAEKISGTYVVME